MVPGQWLLQGGTTGGGGVMRWLEQQFGDYEREEGKRQGKSSLELFNEMAEKVSPGSGGTVFLPYMSGERSPIWDPDAKGVFYGLDFSKTKAHFIRSAMEGVAYALKHNLDVAEEAGAKVSVLRAMAVLPIHCFGHRSSPILRENRSSSLPLIRLQHWAL